MIYLDCKLGKGMEGVKWVVDLNDLEGLPQPQEVSRALLADPNFNVEQFLLKISDFRTLKDVKDVINVWETKLHAELRETVNYNFDDFVKSVKSINSGIDPLQSVYNDSVKYEQLTINNRNTLQEANKQLSKELNEHKRLCKEESDALQVLYMLDLESELETSILELNSSDKETILSFSKSFVAMMLIADKMKHVKLVQVRKISMEAIGSELAITLEQIARKENDFDILQALYFVKGYLS